MCVQPLIFCPPPFLSFLPSFSSSSHPESPPSLSFTLFLWRTAVFPHFLVAMATLQQGRKRGRKRKGGGLWWWWGGTQGVGGGLDEKVVRGMRLEMCEQCECYPSDHQLPPPQQKTNKQTKIAKTKMHSSLSSSIFCNAILPYCPQSFKTQPPHSAVIVIIIIIGSFSRQRWYPRQPGEVALVPWWIPI